MRRFLAGAVYPFRALGVLIRAPRLWGYVGIPILLNLVVGAVVYIGLLLAGLRVIDRFVADLPPWASGLSVLLQLVLVLALLVVLGFVLVRFGVVLGSPWYSRLSARLEEQCSGRPLPPDPGGARAIARDLGRALLFELQKLLLVIGVAVPLLLVNLIPIAGSVISTAGWIALGATIACLDFLDPPLERRRLRFGQKLGLVRQSLPASAGFGLVCLGLISIPFVNLVSIPLCVAAGTIFFCEQGGVIRKAQGSGIRGQGSGV